MFVEMYGSREAGPGAGIGALELRRAAVETAGCRERFDQREWIATGQRAVVAARSHGARHAHRASWAACPAQRMPHGGPQRQDGDDHLRAADGPELTVTDRRAALHRFRNRARCSPIPSRSGARAGPIVGCAAHNPGHAGALSRTRRGHGRHRTPAGSDRLGQAHRRLHRRRHLDRIRHSRLPLARRHLDADTSRSTSTTSWRRRRCAASPGGASSPPTRPCSRPSPTPATARSPSWSSRAR